MLGRKVSGGAGEISYLEEELARQAGKPAAPGGEFPLQRSKPT